MFKCILLFVVVVATTGCETLSDAVSENPFFANVAVRQAVAAYIDAGDTPDAQLKRAIEVRSRVELMQVYLQGNPTASTTNIMAVIDSQIEWEELDPQDRLLVQDIMRLVEWQLVKQQHENKLDPDTQILIRALLSTVVSAAGAFL